MKISRMLASATATILLAAGLSGCSAAVSLDAADDSNNPLCADVMVRLPDTVDGLARRGTNAQSTGAWGTPAHVILRCGLPEVTVSKLTCVTASGVDWLVDDSQKPSYRFVTFARKPAIEVIVDSNNATGVNSLDDLSSAVKSIEATDHCLG
jgi:uncharacterized protein YceK